ncbi:ubiquilin-1-like [Colius striatus]|uniref:ubiquilin-1-like n=1 Tax=Colius striatus TaxID=57412 RepID=UPI002B1E426F|nr:ubiquilin-1-like [Colius striatus]
MDPSDTIKVMVKTLRQKEQFEVPQSCTVWQFKGEVARRFNTQPDLLFLIHAGKVLEDQHTLIHCGIHSGDRIHLIIKSQRRPQDVQAGEGTAATQMRPPGHSNSSVFLGSSAAQQCQNVLLESLAQQLAASQDIVAQIMDNLLSSVMHSNLELNAVGGNSFLSGFLLGVTAVDLLDVQFRDVSDLVQILDEQDVHTYSLGRRFLQYILSNSDLLREILTSSPRLQQLAETDPGLREILNNPQAIIELLQASSNPAVLQEMVRNRDMALNNLESIPGGLTILEQMYREMEEPMDASETQLDDNPFASLDRNPPQSGARLPACTENRTPLPNPWAPQPNSDGDDADDDDALADTDDGSASGLSPTAEAVVTILRESQSMAEQLLDNPELMSSLTTALVSPGSPAQALLSDAAAASHGRSPSQEQWPQELPPEMENVEVSPLLRNLRATQALLQMQVGLYTLMREVPDLLLSLEDVDEDSDLQSDSPQSSESEDDAAEDEAATEAQAEMGEEAPQTRFQTQMEQLRAMGFQDQTAILEALVEAGGDMGAAVKILTSRQTTRRDCDP